jgi:hypothetical protein
VQANCARRSGLALRSLVCPLANLKKRGLLAQHAAIRPLELSDSAPSERASQRQISNLAPARVCPAQHSHPSTHHPGRHIACLPCPLPVRSAEASIAHTTPQTLLTRIPTLTAAAPGTRRQPLYHYPDNEQRSANRSTASPRRTTLQHLRATACDGSPPAHPRIHLVCLHAQNHPLTGTCINAHRLPKRRS